MTIIQMSNRRVWIAVAEARINPGVETRTELLDALNQRRTMREVHHAPIPAIVLAEIHRQCLTWGRVENWTAVRAAAQGAQ